jgi:hypothetical protein
VRIVAIALGLCAFILVAAGVAKALRPHDVASPAPSAALSASAAPTNSAPLAPSAAQTASAAPVDSTPTTGTIYFDHPAKPGKVWVDGKKITAKSVDIPCGTHKIKIGSGKTKPVIVTCGAELHLTH